MKPLLASTCNDPTKLQFPIYASPKYDGIRCVVISEGASTRNLKQIPNDYVRQQIERLCPIGFDGEIITVTDDGRMAPFNEISSAIMSKDGKPNFQFHVFDFVKDWIAPQGEKSYEGMGFRSRLERLEKAVDKINDDRIVLVEQQLINGLDTLNWYEEACLDAGFEGIMVRNMFGTYKFGRSTEREQLLLKIKRFAQDEAVVVGYEELMENTNEAIRSATGNLERSSHKAGLVGKNMLGALIVEMDQVFELNGEVGNHKVRFKIGTGFDEETRVALWSDEWRDYLVGQTVTFKHQPSGAKEGGAPRFPVFIGFRHEDDMS